MEHLVAANIVGDPVRDKICHRSLNSVAPAPNI
jgi:hypothetical protein